MGQVGSKPLVNNYTSKFKCLQQIRYIDILPLMNFNRSNRKNIIFKVRNLKNPFILLSR